MNERRTVEQRLHTIPVSRSCSTLIGRFSDVDRPRRTLPRRSCRRPRRSDLWVFASSAAPSHRPPCGRNRCEGPYARRAAVSGSRVPWSGWTLTSRLAAGNPAVAAVLYAPRLLARARLTATALSRGLTGSHLRRSRIVPVLLSPRRAWPWRQPAGMTGRGGSETLTLHKTPSTKIRKRQNPPSHVSNRPLSHNKSIGKLKLSISI
jgi:hypothetical protein